MPVELPLTEATLGLSTDLLMLVLSAALAWLLILTAAAPKLLRHGLQWSAGNRDEAAEVAPWVKRAERAHANLNENLILFAILVLVVSVTGQANDATALGAVVFFVARCAHAVLYLAGVPWLRTAAWIASLVGMIIIAAQLL